ncbi:MAG: hypothetical protein WAK16_00385 [Candidatus Cybelea sp.]
MTLQQILDIAIVLCAIYAGTSCLCSWVVERIAALLALRGWSLFRGISNLVGSYELATTIFNHPLVLANSAKPDRTVDAAAGSSIARFASVALSRPPSYLEARNFSSALWQALGGEQLSGASGTSESQAIADASAGAPASFINALKTAVTGMNDNQKLQQQLSSLLAQAGDDYPKLLAATDAWFNAEMDRVSGWYRRQAQLIVVIVALFVVTFSGLDTLEMVRTLSILSPTQLSSIADTEQTRVCVSPSPEGISCPTPPPLPAGRTAPMGVTNGPTSQEPFDVTQFAHIHLSIENWSWKSKTSSGLIYYRAPGLVLTWIALTLGGPFWFDLLCSLANARAAGKKPDDNEPQTKST